MKAQTMTPVFVDLMPSRIEPGRLYISIEHRVTKHLCASGCGQPVVLPLHPGQWRLSYDGEHVWLHPSVGNAGLQCRSHYWIQRSRVAWAPPISGDEAQVGRLRDRAGFEAASGAGDPSWWQRLLSRFGAPS